MGRVSHPNLFTDSNNLLASLKFEVQYLHIFFQCGLTRFIQARLKFPIHAFQVSEVRNGDARTAVTLSDLPVQTSGLRFVPC